MNLIAYKPSAELLGLVHKLGGSWSGYRALCCCPAHADRTPSLSIRQGDRGILVKCFAGCASADVLRELSRLADISNLAAPNTLDCDLRPAANVLRLWNEAIDTSGTLAEQYLRVRGIDNRFHHLRYHPRCPKGRRPSTTFTPALLVAVQTSSAMPALQRIFLKADASCSAKLMLGRPGGGAWRGVVADGHRLAIAEGFETAARFTMITGIPCWASLGAARLPMLEIPDAITELIIAEDDDPEGAAAALRAVDAYRQPGRVITRMPPPRPAGLAGANDWARMA